jgi:hypothetical protein
VDLVAVSDSIRIFIWLMICVLVGAFANYLLFFAAGITLSTCCTLLVFPASAR